MSEPPGGHERLNGLDDELQAGVEQGDVQVLAMEHEARVHTARHNGRGGVTLYQIKLRPAKLDLCAVR